MVIDRRIFSGMLYEVADRWQQNAEAFGQMDAKYGDGDHGVTISKIAGLLREKLDGWETGGIKGLLEEVSAGIFALSGGSAGPLYGTLFEGFAQPLHRESESMDARCLKEMLAGCLAAMYDITKARCGDKTMMDVIILAVEEGQCAPDDVDEILKAAAGGALAGKKATEGMVAKFGRARSYGEQTIGSPDPGAASACVLFESLCNGYLRCCGRL